MGRWHGTSLECALVGVCSRYAILPRSLMLPEGVDRESIDARFEGGVL
jgi:hypothetical protein